MFIHLHVSHLPLTQPHPPSVSCWSRWRGAPGASLWTRHSAEPPTPPLSNSARWFPFQFWSNTPSPPRSSRSECQTERLVLCWTDWIKKIPFVSMLPTAVYENNVWVSENDLGKLPLASLYHFRPLYLWLSALSALGEIKLISFIRTSNFVGFFLRLRFHPKSRQAPLCLHRQCSCTLQLSFCV